MKKTHKCEACDGVAVRLVRMPEIDREAVMLCNVCTLKVFRYDSTPDCGLTVRHYMPPETRARFVPTGRRMRLVAKDGVMVPSAPRRPSDGH